MSSKGVGLVGRVWRLAGTYQAQPLCNALNCGGLGTNLGSFGGYLRDFGGVSVRSISGSAGPSLPQFTVTQTEGAGGPVIRKPVYAIFQVGALQYKVSPGDLIYSERLANLDVGAQLSFNTVQAAGTKEQTLVGRPYVDGASVTAVIEEQVQDAKVISFKKRRRKNSRRIKGHRQMLTGLRITEVAGVKIPTKGNAEVLMGHQ